jgi:hypothetical protein
MAIAQGALTPVQSLAISILLMAAIVTASN